MKLYEIIFQHFSQKDSKKGIVCYLVANDDKDVYEWMKNGIQFYTGYEHYTTYQDNEDNGKELDGVPFKESIILTRGCINNDYMEVTDLYYGETQYSWEVIKENISHEDIKKLKELGILLAECEG